MSTKIACDEYVSKLTDVLIGRNWVDVENATNTIFNAWRDHQRVYLCGNGGSAGNAIHLANDLLYGVGGGRRKGIDVEALSANPSVLTCLANDIAYEEIYSKQLEVKGKPGDVLIGLSGSGNSPNIIRALETANNLSMNTIAILGYTGGACLGIAQKVIHFPINDMQISEDLQLIVGHMFMQSLLRMADGQ